MERPPVTSGCNECNEALEMVRATNAITNGDLQRARAVLIELQQVISTPTRWTDDFAGADPAARRLLPRGERT
jgi:hypothetical protein